MTQIDHIKEKDLPAVFCSADKASIQAQQKYLLYVRINLFALTTGALATAMHFHDERTTQFFLFSGAAFLAVGLIATLIISSKNYKHRWYNGRATAESTKTLAWKYMMGAEPFGMEIPEKECEAHFLNNLRDVLSESRYLITTDSNNTGSQPQITEKMQAIRNMDLQARIETYITHRINNQRSWYSKKALFNLESEGKFFTVTAVIQMLALISAIAMILFPEFWFNPIGFLSTAATAFLAWIQVKQYEELSQSYTIAAQELGLIAELAKHIATEESFSNFVADAESAISREHTMWLARRDNLHLVSGSF